MSTSDVDAALEGLVFDEKGLIPAICQDDDSGDVLMLGYMNADTLRETLATGRMVYWKRSWDARWAKGDTSGNRQWVRSAFYDCDGKSLLFRVAQEGTGSCHTGAPNCYFQPLPVTTAD